MEVPASRGDEILRAMSAVLVIDGMADCRCSERRSDAGR